MVSSLLIVKSFWDTLNAFIVPLFSVQSAENVLTPSTSKNGANQEEGEGADLSQESLKT